MTIRDSIFPRLPEETDKQYWDRFEKSPEHRTFRNALSGEAGHKLIQLLVFHRNPVHARFAPGRSNEEAAFRDGQADVIAALMLFGTNLGISKPEQP
jgi:hypothetical protein